jgi:hypothetical protein
MVAANALGFIWVVFDDENESLHIRLRIAGGRFTSSHDIKTKNSRNYAKQSSSEAWVNLSQSKSRAMTRLRCFGFVAFVTSLCGQQGLLAGIDCRLSRTFFSSTSF